MSTDNYRDFIAGKHLTTQECGIRVPPEKLPAKLFDWQRDVVAWSLRIGRTALFWECGLGKTAAQLSWADAIVRHANVKRALVLCPLAVARQTEREADKFGIECRVKVCREPHEVERGISLVNYERLHKFNPAMFDAVVLDEASILKSFMGKTKRMLLDCFARTRFRKTATATPAPNDLMELGNQSDFLGVMPANEMLARWFINDAMSAGNYRLKKHAAKDYWRWVASWGNALESPADLGHDAGGFNLPTLAVEEIIVDAAESTAPPAGMLFDQSALSATTMHREKRATAEARAAKVAEMVNGSKEAWVVWCDTNYEADELVRLIPDAVEVRGSDSVEAKEQKLDAFSTGVARVVISKPSLCGHGMNWQHCRNMAFVGLSYSFEMLYQAIRRCWRFGQLLPVNVWIISTVAEHSITKAVWSKQDAHTRMKSGMVEAMREQQLENLYGRRTLRQYEPGVAMQRPDWLISRRVQA